MLADRIEFVRIKAVRTRATGRRIPPLNEGPKPQLLGGLNVAHAFGKAGAVPPCSGACHCENLFDCSSCLTT